MEVGNLLIIASRNAFLNKETFGYVSLACSQTNTTIQQEEKEFPIFAASVRRFWQVLVSKPFHEEILC